MLAHHVLFWLKPETTQEQKTFFKESLESLKGVETIASIYIGTPAPIERAVVDNTYTFSLMIMFNNLDGHNVYQVHPLHKTFLENCRQYFEKVIIYDAE
jgi:stress responsive alpha/beta barrel protein